MITKEQVKEMSNNELKEKYYDVSTWFSILWCNVNDIYISDKKRKEFEKELEAIEIDLEIVKDEYEYRLSITDNYFYF